MVTKSILKPASIKLSRAELQEKIDRIFEEATHQSECIVNIYRIVFTEWDRIDRIGGYPTVGCGMWLYICKKFIEFDKKHHPECFNSGIWINNGFSSSSKLDDWEIDMSKCDVKYS
ncbi:MAG: hypothetical protein HQK63_16135 [Desulfamplus sp.]|nr:hypothetical protein [Desulfamplus sp.]